MYRPTKGAQARPRDLRDFVSEALNEIPKPSRVRDAAEPRHRRKNDGTRWKKSQDCKPLPYYVLLIIVQENEAEKLVIKLSTKLGWSLLIESQFHLDELQAIFSALKKCCESPQESLLRQFLNDTFAGNNSFVNRCCDLLPSLKEEDLGLIENIISVLEVAADLQLTTLGNACMTLLGPLRNHAMLAIWTSLSAMDLVAKIKTITERIQSNKARFHKGYRTSGGAPNSFRDVEIFPTQADLDETSPFLRSNIIKGAYKSLEHYLDVQFRLLREDFVSPLRSGLREFKALETGISRWKLRAIKDVRFYMRVFFHKPQHDEQESGVKNCVTLVLAEDDFKRVNWERSKRFMNGSLVGISNDNFKTIIFATVRNRDPEKLKLTGTLTLELCFESDALEFRTGVELSLIESSGAYFEAYRYNLAALQAMEEMPLSRYLVFAETSMRKPAYVSLLESYDLAPIMKEPFTKNAKFCLGKWPLVTDSILNPKQFEAVRSAFENELCVIQGPPGTGKTFVGLKIVELMLLNKVTEKPLLIVCYTNHALDQFLEGISKFTEDIVRIGGKCDSLELERFTLRALRRRGRRTTEESHERDLKRRIWASFTDKKSLESLKDEIEKKLACFEGRAIFEDGERSEKLQIEKITRCMAGNRMDDFDEHGDDVHLSDEDRGQLEEEEERTSSRCDSNREKAIQNRLGTYRSHVLDRLNNDYKYSVVRARYKRSKWLELKGSGRDPAVEEHALEASIDFQMELADWWILYKEEHWKKVAAEAKSYVITARKPVTKEIREVSIYVHPEQLNELKVPEIDDVELTIKCLRFKLYSVVARIRRIMGQLVDLENMLDSITIKQAKIIGITTTGAAKYNELLRGVDCEIVLAEEAAEVLEAHLVTCLSPSTKQLVLIGDHQQLQPNTTVFKLATSFNLQVSLFERLIKNDIPYVRLQEQHRMRDEFLNLLVPTIYTDYFSHESVFKYEDVRGVSHNLFFITHESAENAEMENSSKSNLFEADFVTRLALHFRMQGYGANQIVILTTYSGQVFAIKNNIRSLDNRFGWTAMKTIIEPNGKKSRVPLEPEQPVSMFEGIRVTTVDNYQGEESDIVIASFVRSNEDQKIGFLSRDNRICVALSRAKKGFYCVGNMAMLAQASQTWRDISEVLLKGNYVNKGIELVCKVHDVHLLATKGSDFDLFSEGGCSQPCEARLNCGHCCPKSCHVLDSTHEEVKCSQECTRKRPCGHPCFKKCFEDCGKCVIHVMKNLPCGHEADTRCWEPAEYVLCVKPCERSMPCGVHPCGKKCWIHCGKCLEFVEIDASCGHKVKIVCRDSTDENAVSKACDAKVEVELSCGHVNTFECQMKTAGLVNMNMCEQLTTVTCSAGHDFELNCPVARSRTIDEHCESLTPVQLDCGHEICRPCKSIKGLDLKSLTAECTLLVSIAAPCGHEIQIPCREKAKDPYQNSCQVMVEEVLDCGHKVSRKCNEDQRCNANVAVESPCGHVVVAACSRSHDDDISKLCTERCEKILLCGHQCVGTCSSCMGGFHQACPERCGKTLFCGHQCTSECHGQCDPCSVQEKACCPHGTEKKACVVLIHEPCTKKPQHCSHVESPCEATACVDCYCVCDKPCERVLSCGRGSKSKKTKNAGKHTCVGFCSEICVCRICQQEKLSGAVLPAGLDPKNARFIKLPCDHVFESTYLDAYMQEHEKSLNFPKCPSEGCNSQIRLLRRYHLILERIRVRNHEVYVEVFHDRNKMRSAHERFFPDCQKAGRGRKFMDKVFRHSSMPSHFKLQYMTKLFEIMSGKKPQPPTCVNSVIFAKECQLQLLSDCLDLFNRKRLAAGKGPIAHLEDPVPVDNWVVCEQDHVFSMTLNNKHCPKCPRESEVSPENEAEI